MTKKDFAFPDMRGACNCVSLTMEEIESVCCICGHHIFKETWEAAVGEVLSYEREAHNALMIVMLWL